MCQVKPIIIKTLKIKGKCYYLRDVPNITKYTLQ